MALIGKQNLFKSKWLRVNTGFSDTSANGLIQVATVSPSTKAVKAINLSDTRREEVAADLEAAAKAIRQWEESQRAEQVVKKRGLFSRA